MQQAYAESAPGIAPTSIDSDMAKRVPEKYRKLDALTVAVNPEIAPIKFIDDNGNIAGFTPDLLSAAANVLGLKLNFVQSSFDALIPGLSANRYNVLLSLGDFPARHSKVTFIDYLKVGQTIVVAPSSNIAIKSLSDLCGLSVAIPRGTEQLEKGNAVSADCVAAGKKPIVISAYPDSNMTLLSVTTNASQAAWVDSPAANFNTAKFPGKYKAVYFYYNSAYGIGFDTDDDGKKLADAFRLALLTVEKSGTYGKLMQKWGIPQGDGFPTFPINDPSY